MKFWMIFSAIALALSAQGALSATIEQNQPGNSNQANQASQLEAQKFAPSLNRFSVSLFDAVSDNKSGNVAVSPLSIDIVLSQLTFGAGGITKQELESLNSAPNGDDLKQVYQQLFSVLNSTAINEINFANAEFVAEGQKLQSAYQQIAQQYFGSNTENFSDSKQAAEKFNNWIANNINQNNALAQADDFQNPKAVFGNIINFDGKFNTSFNPASTEYDFFYINENLAERVQYITQEDEFDFGYNSQMNASWVKLPFEESGSIAAYNLYVIVPNKYNGLEATEDGLKQYFSNNTEFEKTENRVRLSVSIPLVDIESYKNVESSLEELGLTAPFQNSAEFKNVIEGGNFKISQVSQGARVQLSPEGAKVAVATKINFNAVDATGSTNSGSSANQATNPSSNQSNQSNQSSNQSNQSSANESSANESPANQSPVKFIVNRPFLLVLEEANSGLEVFIARVANPTRNSGPYNNSGANNNAGVNNNNNNNINNSESSN